MRFFWCISIVYPLYADHCLSVAFFFSLSPPMWYYVTYVVTFSHVSIINIVLKTSLQIKIHKNVCDKFKNVVELCVQLWN